MHEVIMPKLGLTMETGKIEKWVKKEGDKVEEGDILFEVMTDKVSLEVESYNSGILKKILREEGEEVPVTEVVAYIGEEGEEVPDKATSSSAGPKVEEKDVEVEEEPKGVIEIDKEAITEKKGPVKISPLARRIAKDAGVDISKIEGTGPGGRIVKEDVENFISSAEEAPVEEKRKKISPLAKKTAREMGIDFKTEPIKGTGPGGRIVKEDILDYAKASKEATKAKEEVPSEAAKGTIKISSEQELKGMRKIIAERMSYSKQNIPHILLTAVADMDNLISLRERFKDKIQAAHDVKITYTDFIVKIIASALRSNLHINSSLQEGKHIIYDDINVGLAVAVKEGLIVPTLYNTDKMGIIEIASKRQELVDKAKQGKLQIDEISNGTITISNLGMFGIRSFTAIINPPQGAIFSIGEIFKAPVVQGDKINIRSQMNITIAVDHRIIDGAVAARFLSEVVDLIQNPEMLMM